MLSDETPLFDKEAYKSLPDDAVFAYITKLKTLHETSNRSFFLRKQSALLLRHIQFLETRLEQRLKSMQQTFNF